MKTTTYYLLCITLITCVLSSCNDFLLDSDNNYRIVFGNNIERVKIHDDSSTVIRKLGRPTSIGIGDFRGYIFDYEEDDLNFTHLIIMEDPLLAYGVISMSVEAPYSGKSKEGIGIGSDRDYVLNKLGTPYMTQSDSSNIKDTYKFEFNYFSIDYTNKKANRISMFILVN